MNNNFSGILLFHALFTFAFLATFLSISAHETFGTADFFVFSLEQYQSTSGQGVVSFVDSDVIEYYPSGSCSLKLTFKVLRYSPKPQFKGTVHPEITNTYFPLNCSAIFPSRLFFLRVVSF